MDNSVGAAFWIISTVIILSSVLVVSLKNIFHCALYLILALFGVAGIFILLNAEFLAAAQVLIYVGGVATLIIFAIMLTSDLAAQKISQTNENRSISFFICLLFALSANVLISGTHVWHYRTDPLPDENVATIGSYLMTEFMLPFEVISILLLAAMIGAIVLVRKERS